MFVILNVSVGAKERGITAGIAVGSVIALEALFAGPISGTSMNPARSFAPALVSQHLAYLWIYLVALKKLEGGGDVWTWVALDPDTKLVPCWLIGKRDAGCAYHFMNNLKGRLANRVQLTTDGHHAYLRGVKDSFGGEVDYAQLYKIYGSPRDRKLATARQSAWGLKRRSSPATPISTTFPQAMLSARI